MLMMEMEEVELDHRVEVYGLLVKLLKWLEPKYEEIEWLEGMEIEDVGVGMWIDLWKGGVHSIDEEHRELARVKAWEVTELKW